MPIIMPYIAQSFSLTYQTLKSEVAKYLHRTDLTAQIPTFVGLAEAYLFRELSIKELEISVTGSTIDGYAILPSDFGTLSKISITSNGSSRLLDYIALADVSTEIDASPGFYSFENGKLRVWGAGTGQPYTLFYIPAVVSLSDAAPTNWLLANAPDLYLDASALEGARYLRDSAQIQFLGQKVGAGIESVRNYTKRRTIPSGGRMQIRAR